MGFLYDKHTCQELRQNFHISSLIQPLLNHSSSVSLSYDPHLFCAIFSNHAIYPPWNSLSSLMPVLVCLCSKVRKERETFWDQGVRSKKFSHFGQGRQFCKSCQNRSCVAFQGISENQGKASMLPVRVCTRCTGVPVLTEMPMSHAWQRSRKRWTLLGLCQWERQRRPWWMVE